MGGSQGKSARPVSPMHHTNGAGNSLTEPGTERILDLVADWRFDHDSAIGHFYLRLTGLRTETAGERRSMVSGTGKEVRMRRRVRPSAIAVGAVFVLLVALVAPAGAAPPNNPFVGSWESIYLDESNEIAWRRTASLSACNSCHRTGADSISANGRSTNPADDWTWINSRRLRRNSARKSPGNTSSLAVHPDFYWMR